MSTYKTRLPKIAATMETQVRKAIWEGLQPIAKGAQANAPEDTTFTVDNLHANQQWAARWMAMQNPDEHSMIPSSAGTNIAVGIMATWYYFFAEHGTVTGERPRPALMPAWESGKGPLLDNVKRTLKSL